MAAWLDDVSVWLKDYPKKAPYLVGVSGGVDSRVLLQVLIFAGFTNLVVCHLDHGLRSDSVRDAEFVRRLAKRLGLPFFTDRVAEWPPKLSVETAARRIRQEFFARAAKEFGSTSVFLGHHADDQVETFLLNVLRGAGSIGQAAIRRQNRMVIDGVELNLLRPLLRTWKHDIREFARKRRLRFLEDTTNQETNFTRNRLRNLLVPEIERILGRPFKPSLLRLSEIAAEESEVLQQLVPPIWKSEELRAGDLRDLPIAIQRRVIHQWLSGKTIPDIGFDEVERVRAMLVNREIAKVNLPSDHWCRRRAGRLFVEARKGPSFSDAS
jgi:tRNA(Ile)-lysidine synthase